MNIRKNIDYSEMHVAIDKAITRNLSQMELYAAIDKAVSTRPEKGAAVAAAEYLNVNYPDARGFSPRNLRRMRDFYRTYEIVPSVLTMAMQVGWTQNVVILEAELTMEERQWYLKAVLQFGWTKLELLDKIENRAHEELVLDNGQEKCDNDKNESEEKLASPATTAVKYLLRQFRQMIPLRRSRGKPRRGVVPWPTMWLPIFMEKRIAFMRC